MIIIIMKSTLFVGVSVLSRLAPTLTKPRCKSKKQMKAGLEQDLGSFGQSIRDVKTAAWTTFENPG
jgi:hypothetical protein